MFTSIKTSKKNKEIVTTLTNKLALGTENVIARIAFSYSISKDRKMELSGINDSQGKEYTSKVLFGEFLDVYIGIVCVHYNLYITHKDIPKYIKMHLDDGLQLIQDDYAQKSSVSGMDFLINKIEKGLRSMQ